MDIDVQTIRAVVDMLRPHFGKDDVYLDLALTRFDLAMAQQRLVEEVEAKDGLAQVVARLQEQQGPMTSGEVKSGPIDVPVDVDPDDIDPDDILS